MKLPFGYELKRRDSPRRTMAAAVGGGRSATQSSRSYENPFQNRYVRSDQVEYDVFDCIARAIPYVDRGIGTLARMIMPFEITCDVEATKEALDDWAAHVSVNGLPSSGIWPFWRAHIAQMLMYGQSAGEIVPSASKRDIARLYNVDKAKLKLIPTSDSMVELGEETNLGEVKPYPRQDLFVFSAANAKGDNPQGHSILASVPYIADIILKMETAIRQKWQRHGAPSFLVNYRFQSDIVVPDAQVQATRSDIETRWHENQHARWNQEGVLDFIAASQGDFIVEAITDGQELDYATPYRSLMEQLIAALHLPPFMLGIQWSTTERLSQQQADAIIGTCEDYRRELEPDVLYILEMVQAYRGLRGKVKLEWADINLQDRVQSAQADLLEAKAIAQKMDNGANAWRYGWIDQEQAAEMAGLEIDGVALAIDLPDNPQAAPPPQQGQQGEGEEQQNPDETAKQDQAKAANEARAKALWRGYP